MVEKYSDSAMGPPSGGFLYRGVANALRERMRSGVYAPGSQIPTVAELAAEFNVSTITVRRAVRDLSLEGMLVGKQGLGVFVARGGKIVRSLLVEGTAPIEHDMAKAGVRGSLRDLGMTVVEPDGEAFLEKLGKGERSLLRLDRVLLADGEPVGLDLLWITPSLADKLADKLRGEFIMSLLAGRGIIVDRLTYQVEATTASEAQASQLNIVPGFPLLVIRFFPVDPRGQPLLVGETTVRADRFTYEFGSRLRVTRVRTYRNVRRRRS